MKKIMFNDSYGLTKAVLNGTKTMTRRIGEKYLTELIKGHETDFTITSQRACPKHLVVESPQLPHGICLWLGTKYRLGEVIAVAQSYYDVYGERQVNGSFYEWCVLHNLDHKKEIHDMEELQKKKGWTNKMFVRPDLMPHQIQITDIKIERLQDISDEDCWKEGIIIKTVGDFGTYAGYGYGERRTSSLDETFSTPRKAFASLINHISGKGTWQSNPIVVAYSFRLIK